MAVSVDSGICLEGQAAFPLELYVEQIYTGPVTVTFLR